VTAEFIGGLRLDGSDAVLGSLALMLAKSLEESPPYARAALARQLADVLERLSEAEQAPANLRLLAGIGP
jgi:hypothetical protein